MRIRAFLLLPSKWELNKTLRELAEWTNSDAQNVRGAAAIVPESFPSPPECTVRK